MKPTKLIGISVVLLLIVAVFFSVKFWNNRKQTMQETDPTETAEVKNEETFVAKADENDAQFIASEAESNLKEIKMAEFAVANFRIHEVKDLASMLLADHTKFLKEIRDFALRKEIAIPEVMNAKGEDEYKILSSKQGNEFDEAYCNLMIANIESYIVIYEKASKERADVEIREWAANTLATLRDHLEFSKQCKKNLKKIEKI